MRSKKLFFNLLMVATILALTLTSALATDKPVIIKLAHVTPPDPMKSPFQAACVGFKGAVEKLTAGRFTVNIYPGGTLGKELDLMEAVKTNQIQVHLATPGGLYRVFPPAYLYSTPFMFKNEAVGMTVVDGTFSQEISEAFTAQTGIQALGFIDLGTYGYYTNSVRPLKTPGDFKGIKFRAMDQLQIAMFKALGASAVPIPFPELYTSLQTGVIQGELNPTFLIDQAKFFEVQKYCTIVPATYSPLLFVANKQWYEALSYEDQRIMRLGIKYAKAVSRGLGILLDNMAVDELKKKGMEIVVLSAADTEDFVRIVRPKCLEMLKTQMDPKWVEGLVKATKAAEAQLGY
jgi:tripartite ATP-independent transporter DctP family solute receptor